MPVVDNTAFKQILDTIKKHPTKAFYRIEWYLLANGVFSKPLAYVESNREDNFIQNYCQSTTVVLRMTQKMFFDVVYANKDNLRIVRKKIPIGEVSDEPLPGMPIEVATFKAILLTIQDPEMQGRISIDDEQVMQDYTFTIIASAVDQLRTTRLGIIPRFSTMLDTAVAMLTIYSQQLDLPDDESIFGVTYEPTDIEEIPDQQLVEHNTPILDLVDYLQGSCGGIYNQGCGLYYSNRNWFIYPLFNSKRYQKAEYPCDIVVCSPNLQPDIERTYTIKNKRLFIAGTAGMKQVNMEDIEFLNLGNGVRFILATEFFNKPVEVRDNKALTRIDDIMANMSIKQRPSGIDFAPFSKTRVSDNVAQHMSAISVRKGQFLHIPWDNSDPDLLVPGQPCRVLYDANGKKYEVFGTILGCQTHQKLNQPGMTGVRYRTSSVLLVFVNRPNE